MYNIAKVAKGEVLPYFNDIFDALCKVTLPTHAFLLCRVNVLTAVAWSRF
jgi:hypothetical protein